MVLNPDMGLVSPQFHIKLDSNFQTLREKGAWIPPSTWQIKCSFIQQPTKTSPPDLVPETGGMTGALPMHSQRELSQPTVMNHSWPQRLNPNKIKIWNHRNYLHCKGPGISANQLIN